MSFKKGDKVICINPDSSLEMGKEYTISAVDFAHVGVEGKYGDIPSYFPWRFRLVPTVKDIFGKDVSVPDPEVLQKFEDQVVAEAVKQIQYKDEAARRKGQPLARGVLDYFPDALLAVAELSRIGNEQHNPGQPMHWAKEKSTDHADCILRHLIDRGTVDTDGVRHSAKVAWRALALLQIEIDNEKAKGK